MMAHKSAKKPTFAETGNFSDEQQDMVSENVRQLLSSLHEMLVKLERRQATPAQIAEADEVMEDGDGPTGLDLEES